MLNFGGGNYSLMNDMKLDYGNVGAEQGMFSPGQGQANGTGGILGKVLSSFGPAGGAVGGAIDGLLSTGSQVTGPGESRDVGRAVAKGAMKGAAGGLLKGIGDGLADQAVDGMVDQAADTATDTAMQEIMRAGSGSMGDAYRAGLDKFAANAGDMQTTTIMGDIYATGKNALSNATSGLIGGKYGSMPDKGSFFANFRQGFKGGGADTAIANLRDGNYGAVAGQAAQYGANNYRPPEEDQMIKKMRIRY